MALIDAATIQIKLKYIMTENVEEKMKLYF